MSSHNSSKNILIAFLLNLFFSVFELIGGLITGSVSILSDAIHDFGDATSIGLSHFFEKKSEKPANSTYTYGYSRYSLLGSVITTSILLIGSFFIVCEAVERIVSPVNVDHNKMLLFAIIGVVVNTIAAITTRGGKSANQKAVNLHMLEDVFGWIAVLIGAIIISFTGFNVIDPILSICVSVFIMVNAWKHMYKSMIPFLEKSPVNTLEIIQELKKIDGIIDIHHVHIWSIDGELNCATMHVMVNSNHKEIKNKIRKKLLDFKIVHSTIELESKWEHCDNRNCELQTKEISCKCCENH